MVEEESDVDDDDEDDDIDIEIVEVSEDSYESECSEDEGVAETTVMTFKRGRKPKKQPRVPKERRPRRRPINHYRRHAPDPDVIRATLTWYANHPSHYI